MCVFSTVMFFVLSRDAPLPQEHSSFFPGYFLKPLTHSGSVDVNSLFISPKRTDGRFLDYNQNTYSFFQVHFFSWFLYWNVDRFHISNHTIIGDDNQPWHISACLLVAIYMFTGSKALDGLGRAEVKWSESRSVVSDSLQPHGLYSPWNSPGQNIGVGSRSLLQRIVPTQG